MSVNSFKFMSRTLAESLQRWPYVDTSGEKIPWTPLAKPVAECKVALVSSGGFYRVGDEPFDLDRERREPLWGDPSFRELPRSITQEEIRAAHLHFENSHAMRDFNCMLPLGALEELLEAGRIGSISETHLSIMGYQPKVRVLIQETAARMAERLRQLDVDLVLISPG